MTLSSCQRQLSKVIHHGSVFQLLDPPKPSFSPRVTGDLASNKIGTRLLLPETYSGNLILREEASRRRGLENTDKIMHDTFWIGVHPSVTPEMIDFTAEVIRQRLHQ